MPSDIFVIGMDDFNRQKLDLVEREQRHRFHDLFTLETIRERQHGEVESLLEEAVDVLETFEDSGDGLDGIIAYWDFPVQTMLPILRRQFGHPGPSLESVLKCEHKYWSRWEQKKVIPAHVPDVQWFDPFDAPRKQIDLDFPFWIKPVKATNSQLGFMIEDENDLAAALDEIRDGIGRFGHWFDQFLSRVDLPPAVASVSGRHCVAESILQGTQHTLCGWANSGCIQTYGVVDSHNYPDRSSFFRYHYPSNLPARVRDRMAGIGSLLMHSLDFRHEAFNIEFFYDSESDHLAVLEVNPRMSQSHGDLFQKVDGLPNHAVAADLALGRVPRFPFRKGRFACAGKFYLRAFEDAVVRSVPTEDARKALEAEIDGALVDVRVQAGDQLSQVQDRDSYSFELAHIYLGAESEEQLLDQYDRCVEMLPFELEEIA